VSVTTTSLPRGKQQVTATADPGNTVAESDESNNRATATART
jgi:subtilase family serine protease